MINMLNENKCKLMNFVLNFIFLIKYAIKFKWTRNSTQPHISSLWCKTSLSKLVFLRAVCFVLIKLLANRKPSVTLYCILHTCTNHTNSWTDFGNYYKAIQKQDFLLCLSRYVIFFFSHSRYFATHCKFTSSGFVFQWIRLFHPYLHRC